MQTQRRAGDGAVARPLLCCVLAAQSRASLDEAALPEGPFAHRAALLQAGPLLAVVAPLRSSTEVERPRVADLVAYGRLIDHVHARCTTIPIRFGTVLEDGAAVQQHLDERAADYLRLLAELHDAVEVAVRMTVPLAPPAAAPVPAIPVGAGAAYLRAVKARLDQLKQQEGHAARQAEWLRAELAAGTRAQALSLKPLVPPRAADAQREQRPETEAAPQPEPVVSASFLIARGALAQFQQRVAELAQRSGRALTLHGPFPPYSFVQLEPRAATGRAL